MTVNDSTVPHRSAPEMPIGASDPWRANPMVTFLATGLGSGMIRPYSGSWGSIPGVLIGWGLLRLGDDWLYVASTLAMIALSVWVSGKAEPLFGRDSGRIVIDEFAGAFVALLGLPTHWHIIIPVFVLFRIFDVVKPYPCRRLERLPGGWGVTADDVGAGVYTNLTVRVLVLIWPAWFGV